MSLIRMNAQGVSAREHGTGASPITALAPLLQRDGPIIVMVHGYRFAPDQPGHCPHLHIFQGAGDRARSWPSGLGIGPATGPGGLAFGWQARGTIWHAHAQAAVAGKALARMLRLIHHRDPARDVHAIGHSLGARVILSAMRHLPAGALSRVILLAAADHASAARAALDSPAGRRARLLHVTSGENRVYDLALRGLISLPGPGDMVLGRADLPGLPTLRLDAPGHLAGLAALGYPVAPPQRRICHWSTYMRDGVFPLYRALMGPQGAPLHAELTRLSTQTPLPARVPGWSLPLPWGANPS